MFNHERGAFPLRIGIALAAALLLFALPAAGSEDSDSGAVGVVIEEPPTAAQCESQWASSAADETCQNESISAEDGMCRVEAECLWPVMTSSQEENCWLCDVYYAVDNDFLGSLDEVARLSNCEGTLTVGSC